MKNICIIIIRHNLNMIENKVGECEGIGEVPLRSRSVVHSGLRCHSSTPVGRLMEKWMGGWMRGWMGGWMRGCSM